MTWRLVDNNFRRYETRFPWTNLNYFLNMSMHELRKTPKTLVTNVGAQAALQINDFLNTSLKIRHLSLFSWFGLLNAAA